MFPNASKVIGIDLSPYMLAIGGYLMKEMSVPENSITENGLKNSDFEWVDVIEEDNWVEFRYDDIANTDIESGNKCKIFLPIFIYTGHSSAYTFYDINYYTLLNADVVIQTFLMMLIYLFFYAFHLISYFLAHDSLKALLVL